MVTLGKMFQVTDPVIKQNANKVSTSVKTLKMSFDEHGEFKLIMGVSKDHDSRVPHVWTAKIYGEARNPRSEAWVHCNCEYFLFNCEVALAVQGSSTVVNSNGKRPKITNPSMKPKICKHLVAAMRFALLKETNKEATEKDLSKIPQKGRPNVTPRF